MVIPQLSVGPPIAKKVRVTLVGLAVVAPVAFGVTGAAIAQLGPAHAVAIFGVAIALGIVVGAAAIARAIRLRLGAFVAVLAYLTAVVPPAFYVWAWSNCVLFGDCL